MTRFDPDLDEFIAHLGMLEDAAYQLGESTDATAQARLEAEITRVRKILISSFTMR